ncbi:YkvA family protein [Sphingobacterium sp. ML3W]|uniref:YkvA family protein n=1 Tax=Sphingobacterium sp. ML3W TaxID=1538644 RepID=UPI00068CDFBA|nr:YkvA family protein [Sphingobacterium sp. ML3W]
MKKRFLSKALTLFEVFKTHKITARDLENAEVKAQNLDARKEDFRLLIAMCKDTFSGRYKMDKWNLSVIVATIAYVVSPLDAIPDVIPVLGWVDDITIIGYAITKLSEEISKYKLFKKQVLPAEN